jgi:myo-inositol 2-dehydrogenase / D-chiro-inositol 1-dehydrogenase
MRTPTTTREPEMIDRRTFMKTTAAATAAATANLVLPHRVHAAGSDTLRVGLVGCGGRGTGAARDCLRAADGVELVALGDVMPDRLAQCREQLAGVAAEDPAFAAKLRISDDRCFTGLDAYRDVIASDIDLVLLATPPGFRPAHLAAAVDAGLHVFTEKPVAVDADGIRSVLATYERALQQDLGIVAGTQRRHQAEYLETIARIHDGAIGDVLGGQVYWNQGALWSREKEPGWSDVEWQIRNWLYFTWLSGDHIVEQHVHNIDVANWVIGAHPVRATAVGGRQRRTEPRFGHIYDHFAVDFEYESGARVLSMCRQMQGCANHVGEMFSGTAGRSNGAGTIEGPRAWSWTKPEVEVSPYVQEHIDLIASIRAGRPLNELKQVTESTLSAIMGREAAYTGQAITWDEMLAAEQSLAPPSLEFGSLDVPAVPMPGVTKLARRWGDV